MAVSPQAAQEAQHTADPMLSRLCPGCGSSTTCHDHTSGLTSRVAVPPTLGHHRTVAVDASTRCRALTTNLLLNRGTVQI
eukprot:scaffold17526_cov64-Phaeocystis_antarctica.AAC.1